MRRKSRGIKYHIDSVSTKDYFQSRSRPELTSPSEHNTFKRNANGRALWFNGYGYKCFRQPHTLWTWRSWQCPFSLLLFSYCQALAADHTPSLLCCSSMPSSLRPVINKEWGDASWMEVSGTTPSWAKSALQLAFLVVTGSNSVTLTDGKAQSIAGSKGYWAGKWEL